MRKSTENGESMQTGQDSNPQLYRCEATLLSPDPLCYLAALSATLHTGHVDLLSSSIFQWPLSQHAQRFQQSVGGPRGQLPPPILLPSPMTWLIHPNGSLQPQPSLSSAAFNTLLFTETTKPKLHKSGCYINPLLLQWVWNAEAVFHFEPCVSGREGIATGKA